MLTVTPAAVAHIKAAIAKRGSGQGIRIGVKPSGCNGYAYVLEYIDEVDHETMAMFTQDDVNVFVATKDLPTLYGLTVDYVKHGLNEGFELTNPQETGRCGCGTSFSI